jgi:GAF domain-containing protein
MWRRDRARSRAKAHDILHGNIDTMNVYFGSGSGWSTRGPETTLMQRNPSDKVSICLARIADLRSRADAEIDPIGKAELRMREAQWWTILESYQIVDEAGRYLRDLRERRSTQLQVLPSAHSPVDGASLAAQLKVLVYAAIEHTEGKARAAFYLADAAGTELHHVTGMTDAYARYVNGFVISEQSLACGLAVAKRQPIITPDVSKEPRWKQWLWLAEEFRYRACWSFPVTTSSGKVLGSLAVYYPDCREATQRDLDLASVLTRTAAAIITRR